MPQISRMPQTSINNPLNPSGVGLVNIFGDSQSRLYLHMRAKFGRGLTVVSKKGSLKFISRFLLCAYFVRCFRALLWTASIFLDFLRFSFLRSSVIFISSSDSHLLILHAILFPRLSKKIIIFILVTQSNFYKRTVLLLERFPYFDWLLCPGCDCFSLFFQVMCSWHRRLASCDFDMYRWINCQLTTNCFGFI